MSKDTDDGDGYAITIPINPEATALPQGTLTRIGGQPTIVTAPIGKHDGRQAAASLHKGDRETRLVRQAGKHMHGSSRDRRELNLGTYRTHSNSQTMQSEKPCDGQPITITYLPPHLQACPQASTSTPSEKRVPGEKKVDVHVTMLDIPSHTK